MINLLYSVVIPVFNSESTVEKVVERTAAFFQSKSLNYEIILINDGSRDQSWKALCRICEKYEHVTAIDLLKNYGQHHANLCGFHYAQGDYVITLDDDLQNPPEEIEKLIEKEKEGHDLVLGRYEAKQHQAYRRWGSSVVNALNEKIFRKPTELVMSNFRLIHRSIIDRVKSYRGPEPYIPGLVILYASRPANVLVQHAPRTKGKSGYSLTKISKLIFTLLFNYSIFPLRFLVILGGAIALMSFLMGGFFLLRGLLHDVKTSGWTSIVTMISFFSGFIILLLGVLGEYMIRILRSVSGQAPYHIRDIQKR